MKVIFTIFFLSFFFASCTKNGCLEEAGSRVTTVRNGATIREIRLFDNIDLVLKQDTAEKISVSAGNNLEPFIETSFEKEVLTIRNNLQCQWLRDPAEAITVYVSVKNLEKLYYEGSGNVGSENTILADNFTFYTELGAGNIDLTLDARQTFSYIMDESTDLTLRGSSEAMWSYTNSRGSIDFSNFEVRKMVIEYGGVRDANINVTTELNAILYFKGNLYYKGNPVITQNKQHSSGRLIKLP